MNNQREIVYNRRNYALHEDDILNELNQIIEEYIIDCLGRFCGDKNPENWDLDSYKEELLDIFALDLKTEKGFNNIEDAKKYL
jgi:preprotein translocase subunit SecA